MIARRHQRLKRKIMNNLLEVLTHSNLLIYFIFDVVTVSILAYGIYFKRYFDRDAVTAAVLFNIFVFGVVTAFQNLAEGMGIGFGFGLFAILSLITLRSEVLTKTDITYFFGALAIALINALSLPSVELVAALNVIALLAAWIVDHPKLLSEIQNTKLVLDHIPESVLNESDEALEYLSNKFSVTVISYRVVSIDEVNDTAWLNIAYKKLAPNSKQIQRENPAHEFNVR
jgi:hypothetical protein